MATGAAASLKLVWAALLTGMLLVLGVALVLRPRLEPQQGLGVLTWMSIAWCALSTITAAILRAVGSEAREPAKRRGFAIAAMGLLDSGAVFAAVVHLVSPLDFGIYAAVVPLGAMLAFFPRDATGA
jgi:hypothetical protein